MRHTKWQLMWLLSALLLLSTACGGGDAKGDQEIAEQNNGTNNGTNNGDNNGTNNGTNNGDNNGVEDPANNGEVPVDEPELGDSDFVSADGNNGEASPDRDAEPEAGLDDQDSDGAGDERTVEEGDIYRVMGDGRILNLNAYRGLQVINVSDIAEPYVEGRAQITGYPVEMYVVGDRAVVLMNNWQGYYRSIHDTRPESYQGGMVVTIDISDPHAPRITDRAQVPGWIRTSRLTRAGDQVALYTAASHWGAYLNEEGEEVSGSFTYVRSFSLSGDDLEERSEVNLGGYVGDIQATTEALMVSRIDWRRDEPSSTISLIDITDPDGAMVEGDEVEVRGYVASKHNMNLYNGVLRIVSGSTWGNSRTNHVQTYDASDFAHLEEIDHDTFGDNENLFATLFLDNKAFFVTYRQVDPFHAYEITDEGQIIPHAEYIISGWNNFLRPVFDKERLLGIGVDDADGERRLAVSLYDITDLGNPDPFLARQHVEASWSWSEANWDDRAFSVLQDAVEVQTEDGTTETGLVLLPFSGWDRDSQTYTAAVQIFTFSRDSLTQRGIMHHDTPVRRSFLADDTTTANLSEAEMSFFDHTSPDQPRELGRVELAPNYADFLIFGDYGVRVKNNQDYYGWWNDQQRERPGDVLDVVSLSEHPDTAEALAQIVVPAGSRVVKVGQDKLVAVTLRYNYEEDRQDYRYDTRMQVWDLSQPTSPRMRGDLETDQINPFYGYGYGWGWGEIDDCWGCYYYPTTTTLATDKALVFPQAVQNQESLGMEEICTTYAESDYDYYECYDEDGPQACEYVTGSRTCRNLEGDEPWCTGSFYRCTQDEDGARTCEPIEGEELETRTNCYERERFRYWWHYELQVVDLSDPDAPTLRQPIDMGSEKEGVSALAKGDAVYVTWRRPVRVQGDSRPYVRYFFDRVDLSQPEAPVLEDSVNIPGVLMSVDNDGGTIFTQDTVWGENVVETALNKLSVRDGRAYLNARRRFVDQQVYSVDLDERGNLLVSHRLAWYVQNQTNQGEVTQKLSVLNARSNSFEVRAEVDVDYWAQLRDVREGRALFSVPGGLLVMNLDEPTSPYAQAYFPVRGWPQRILLHEDDVYFAGGRYGMYRFALEADNLLR